MRVILDLCGGTGSWSQPYADAGYDVRVIDLPTDVRMFELPDTQIHGILAAPPCTYFCRMRMCRGRPTDEQFKEGLSVIDACLRVILLTRPKWWALENPQGYLHNWLGQPRLKFHPWHYGDAWTKNTWLWGDFQIPEQSPVEPVGPLVKTSKGSPERRKGMVKTFTERARTPAGFARAFFEANP